jgi:hypothetical protein
VIGDVAQGVAADVDHLEARLAQQHNVAAAHHAVERCDAGHLGRADDLAPVAAFRAALPPAWSGCQWVLRIRSRLQPAAASSALDRLGVGRVDAGDLAAGFVANARKP